MEGWARDRDVQSFAEAPAQEQKNYGKTNDNADPQGDQVGVQ